MRKRKVLVSLITKDNDYQLEQSRSAESMAERLGLQVEVVFAGGDAVDQSTQVLKVVQSAPEMRPDAIVIEPAGGTAFPQVARAAVNSGIAWAVLNREATYLFELRQSAKVPVFGVSADQVEVGRIQCRQCAALLPRGGSILYIQGPSESSVAKERSMGLQETKPASIRLTTLKGQWTEESAQRAVASWLKLSTFRNTKIDLIAGQNDSMAIGARRAFQELLSELEREPWLNVPYIGVDGVTNTGQAWVRSGLLTATVVTPPSAGPAIELLAAALQSGKTPPERNLTQCFSLPPIETLRPAN